MTIRADPWFSSPSAPPREKTELAVALYADDVLAFGKARELSGLPLREFAQVLGSRGILRHYDGTELTRDIHYARGQ